MDKIIEIDNLVKEFKVPQENKKKGFFQKLKNVFYKKYKTKKVLKNLSFNIKEGEFVGFIGPNGAGKSTTIKVMTGILTPTFGDVKILGVNPKQDRRYYKHIGVVFGQRSLLEFDIPVIESFKLYKDIYEIPESSFKKRLAEFSKILEIDKFLHMPVRKLSLGQRMRCEIAAALLHNPKIVYLDEPTIGLDVIAKENIRKFLKRINRELKTTIILTTHDMGDIEDTCERIIVIDEGKIIYDGSLKNFNKEYLGYKTFEVDYEKILDKKKLSAFLRGKEVIERNGKVIKFKVLEKADKNKIIKKLPDMLEIRDILIHTPRLEVAIKEIYRHNKK